jgi:hypothetical protein
MGDDNICDVCGLVDPYNGTGDGIGSCDCPRCDYCGVADGSVLCTCPSDDSLDYDDGETQSVTACCPRETIPDSCSCPDGCDCWCRDCQCGDAKDPF